MTKRKLANKIAASGRSLVPDVLKNIMPEEVKPEKADPVAAAYKSKAVATRRQLKVAFSCFVVVAVVLASVLMGVYIPSDGGGNGTPDGGNGTIITENFSKLYIDINPSVVLTVKNNVEITEQAAVNGDGAKLLFGLSLVGMTVETAIEKVLFQAENMGYLVKNNDNAIMISVDGDEAVDNEKLLQKSEEYVELHMERQGLFGIIGIMEGIDNMFDFEENIEEAEELEISPAKYTLIMQIQMFAKVDQFGNYEEKYQTVNLKDKSIFELSLILSEAATEFGQDFKWRIKEIGRLFG